MSSDKAPQSPFRLTCWKPAVSSLQWSINSWNSALRSTILHAWNLYIFKCWFIFHTTNFLGAENVPTTGEMWATRLVWPPLPSSGNTVRSRHPQTPPSGSRQSSEERQWGELHKDELLTRGTPPLYLWSTTPHIFGDRAAPCPAVSSRLWLASACKEAYRTCRGPPGSRVGSGYT